jgi:hypothetical protein
MTNVETNNLVGKMIRMVEMIDDPRPIESGTMGVIYHVDSLGTLHVHWENGRRLGVVPDVDRYEVVN